MYYVKTNLVADPQNVFGRTLYTREGSTILCKLWWIKTWMIEEITCIPNSLNADSLDTGFFIYVRGISDKHNEKKTHSGDENLKATKNDML
jgi:hypothetical protein